MKLKEVCSWLDSCIPLSFQESYDNAGLQTGLPGNDVHSALVTIDVTEEVIDEAINEGCDLIVSHHPLFFGAIKRLTGGTYVERVAMKAIKNDIAVYSAHTNLDAFEKGVSWKMAEKLSLKNVRVLSPLKNQLLKLVTYIPELYYDKVSAAVFEAGAGVIGNYDKCGFTASGTGSFRGNENSNPFAGEKGIISFEKELRFETILFSHLKNRVIEALLKSHPYEEVAYDIYRLENDNIEIGTGCTGEFESEIDEKDFLKLVSSVFSSRGVRYSHLTGKKVKKIAVCGGAGASLIGQAIASGADAYITADIKYHNFFDADNKILLADIGHYESEFFAIEILIDLIIKKFPKFAVRFSKTNTNPINYL